MSQSGVDFDIVGDIVAKEVIARGNTIREVKRLRRLYGFGKWRKCKGLATIRLPNGALHWAEIHWYEAHGIGMREPKIKYLLD